MDDVIGGWFARDPDPLGRGQQPLVTAHEVGASASLHRRCPEAGKPIGGCP